MPMPTMLTQNGTGTSSIWIPDWMQNPFNVAIGTIVQAGSATYNVEHTLNSLDVQGLGTAAANATWYQNSAISAATTSLNGNYAYPVQGIRINVTSCNSTAIVVVNLIQATYGGT